MDAIIEEYKRGKFNKCLELIKLIPPKDNFIDDFLVQNCYLICKAVINILQNNNDGKHDVKEQLQVFSDQVTSVGLLPISFSVQLQLIAIFNFFWWLLFYSDDVLGDTKYEEHLKVINSRLSRVLGKNSTDEPIYLKTLEKIFQNLCSLAELAANVNLKTSFLIIEIVEIVLFYVLKHQEDFSVQCIKIVDIFLSHSEHNLVHIMNNNKSSEKDDKSSYLFKFGLTKVATILSDVNYSSIDYLLILKGIFLYTSNNYKECLNCLKTNTKSNFPLMNYLNALCSFELKKINLCKKFISQTEISSLQKELQVKFLILSGKINSLEGQHKIALKHFIDASNFEDISPLPYYYIGFEWGKMGLYDMMLKYFTKLLQVFQNHHSLINLNFNLENFLLQKIHPITEIAEYEIMYALAISHGLNEEFCQAANTFERFFQCFPINKLNDNAKRVIPIPHWLTVLHDASIINLLAGNLKKAEETVISAIRQYQPQNPNKNSSDSSNEFFLSKNIVWLEKVIESELLEFDVTWNETKYDSEAYSEELIYFLPENVIGLLILSEIQKIQKSEDYAKTLKKIFSIFSNYLAEIVKKEFFTETEKRASQLIKTLASKTCLAIAKVQIQSNYSINVEKMLKRCLSCNKGDKDVLSTYCQFFIKNGKKREASKLLNSFRNEKTLVPYDLLQSLSLRYFLSTNVTSVELEKIEAECNQTQ